MTCSIQNILMQTKKSLYTQILKSYVESECNERYYPPRIRLDISLWTPPNPQSPLMYEVPVKGIPNLTHFLLRADYDLIQPEIQNTLQANCIKSETAHQEIIYCKSCHHSELCRQLSKHAAEWREIGEQLGFQPNELDIIKAGSQEGPKRYLSAMLDKWLQWAPGDGRRSKDYATLNYLKIAISNAGFGRTAEQLILSD